MTENSTAGSFTLNEPEESEDLSLFAELQAEAEKSIEREPLVLAVERRHGWAVEYTGDLTLGEMQRMMKRCRIKGTGKAGQPDTMDLDQVRFSGMVLGAVNSALLRVVSGTDKIERRLEDAAGDPVNLAHDQFLKSFSPEGSRDALAAMNKFMGESGVQSHATAVLEWLGLGAEAERLNPTNG